MSLLSGLVRALSTEKAAASGVVFVLPLDCDDWSSAGGEVLKGVADLEDSMRERLAETGLGELDWHDVTDDGRELRIFVCATEPDAAFEALYPVVSCGWVCDGAYAQLRYTSAGVPTRIWL